jgi:hypothetical protein
MRDSRSSRREATNENLAQKPKSNHTSTTRTRSHPGAGSPAHGADSRPTSACTAAPRAAVLMVELGNQNRKVSAYPPRGRQACRIHASYLRAEPMSPRAVDLSGQTFGHWTVIKRVLLSSKKAMWQCRCECGTVRSVAGHSLTAGGTRSCGCRKRDNPQIPLVPHPPACGG